MNRSVFLIAFLYILNTLFWLICLFSFTTPGNLEIDTSVFATVSNQLNQGKTLYRDVWEHKPPGIFILQSGWFLLTGLGIYSLYMLQVLLVACLSVFTFMFSRRFLNSNLKGILMSCMYAGFMFQPLMYSSGNLTEVYGMTCILCSVLCGFIYLKSEKQEMGVVACVLAGLSFWFKEPFVLEALVILVFLWFQKKNRYLPVAFAAPTVLIFLWLFVHGNIAEYIESVKYNIFYSLDSSKNNEILSNLSGFFGWSLPVVLLVIAGIISIFTSYNQKSERAFLAMVILLLLGEVYSASLSGYAFGHYYLPVVNGIFLLCLMGIKWLDRFPVKAVQLSLLILLMSIPVIQYFKYRPAIKVFPEKYVPDALERFLFSNANPHDKMFIDYADACHYYVKSGLMPDTRFVIPVAIHFIQNDERSAKNRELLFSQISDNRHRFLITTTTPSIFYCISNHKGYYESHYERKLSLKDKYQKEVILWELKQIYQKQ